MTICIYIYIYICIRVKVKVQFTLEQATKAQKGSSSTLSLTSALGGVGGHRHAPAALPPGKETRYALYSRLGGPQGRSGRVRKILSPSKYIYIYMCVCVYTHTHTHTKYYLLRRQYRHRVGDFF